MNPESAGIFFPGPIFPKNFVRDFFGETQQYEVSLPKQQTSNKFLPSEIVNTGNLISLAIESLASDASVTSP